MTTGITPQGMPQSSKPMSNIPIEPYKVDLNMFGTEMGTIALPDLDWSSQLPAFEPLTDNLFDRLSPLPMPIFNPEDGIPADELRTLQMCYFDSVYFSFPFINQDRFLAESQANSPGMKALAYALALAGCGNSPTHIDKKAKCYALAREYCESCERDANFKDINLLQALVLLGRFEALEGKLEGSWMTLGRAAILSRLMGLSQMDDESETAGARSSKSVEPVLAEEHRRTFWALYIMQSYLRTRTGWPCTGDKNEVRLKRSHIRHSSWVTDTQTDLRCPSTSTGNAVC
jgi:hypothetical protein